MFGPLLNYEILREKTCCCFNARHPDPTCLMCLNVFFPLTVTPKVTQSEARYMDLFETQVPPIG